MAGCGGNGEVKASYLKVSVQIDVQVLKLMGLQGKTLLE